MFGIDTVECVVVYVQRAGFEGKKGEAFLNADKKGSKFAGKTTTASRK